MVSIFGLTTSYSTDDEKKGDLMGNHPSSFLHHENAFLKALGCLYSARRTHNIPIPARDSNSPVPLLTVIRGEAQATIQTSEDWREIHRSKSESFTKVTEWCYMFPWNPACDLERILYDQRYFVPHYVLGSPPVIETKGRRETRAIEHFSNKPLGDDAIRCIAWQLVDNIQSIHKQGLSHGGIQLSTVSLTSDLKVIWDPVSNAALCHDQRDTGKVQLEGNGQRLETSEKRVAYNSRWLAPECFCGVDDEDFREMNPLSSIKSLRNPQPLNHANKPGDIWSFGCILLSLAVGKRPFEDEDDESVQTKLKLFAKQANVDKKRYSVSIFPNPTSTQSENHKTWIVERVLGRYGYLVSSQVGETIKSINPQLLDLICACLRIVPHERPMVEALKSFIFLSREPTSPFLSDHLNGDYGARTQFDKQMRQMLFNGYHASIASSDEFRSRIKKHFISSLTLSMSCVGLMCRNAWLLRALSSFHRTRRTMVQKKETDMKLRMETLSGIQPPFVNWDLSLFVCSELVAFVQQEMRYPVTTLFIRECYQLNNDEEILKWCTNWALLVAQQVPNRAPNFSLQSGSPPLQTPRHHRRKASPASAFVTRRFQQSTTALRRRECTEFRSTSSTPISSPYLPYDYSPSFAVDASGDFSFDTPLSLSTSASHSFNRLAHSQRSKNDSVLVQSKETTAVNSDGVDPFPCTDLAGGDVKYLQTSLLQINQSSPHLSETQHEESASPPVVVCPSPSPPMQTSPAKFGLTAIEAIFPGCALDEDFKVIITAERSEEFIKRDEPYSSAAWRRRRPPQLVVCFFLITTASTILLVFGLTVLLKVVL